MGQEAAPVRKPTAWRKNIDYILVQKCQVAYWVNYAGRVSLLLSSLYNTVKFRAHPYIFLSSSMRVSCLLVLFLQLSSRFVEALSSHFTHLLRKCLCVSCKMGVVRYWDIRYLVCNCVPWMLVAELVCWVWVDTVCWIVVHWIPLFDFREQWRKRSMNVRSLRKHFPSE